MCVEIRNQRLCTIVDESDNVIGQELKSKCHKEKILHRGSNIFVFSDKSLNKIFLQKRSLRKKLNPGQLCTPGGHIQVGESYLDGAKREFFEEMLNSKIGNKNLEFEKLFKLKKFTDNDYEFMTLFRTVCSGPFSFDSLEVESGFFEDINETLKKIEIKPENYTGTTVLLLKEYKKSFL